MMVSIKCPYCGGEALKKAVNPSCGLSTLHATCHKCHKRISIETNKGKVRVFKD